MRLVQQKMEDIVSGLSALATDWQDATSARVMARLQAFEARNHYTRDHVIDLLRQGFDDGLLICRLFLGLSKDEHETALAAALGSGGIGVTRFQRDPVAYAEVHVQLGLLDMMAAQVNREVHWSDVLVERLRSGRGKAIRGQQRGRGLENFAEGIIQKVFGKAYDTRCSFVGADGKEAKCDFAIPGRREPRILIESKGYGATGSKMSDIIGDLTTIVSGKRHDTTLIFVTDGVTWRRRLSDLSKIVAMQNRGQIARIYTTSMAGQFEADLLTLKQEHGIESIS